MIEDSKLKFGIDYCMIHKIIRIWSLKIAYLHIGIIFRNVQIAITDVTGYKIG